MKNKLFTECQSGFIPGDSCVSRLLFITHEVYKSSDISRAFVEIRHVLSLNL